MIGDAAGDVQGDNSGILRRSAPSPPGHGGGLTREEGGVHWRDFEGKEYPEFLLWCLPDEIGYRLMETQETRKGRGGE